MYPKIKNKIHLLEERVKISIAKNPLKTYFWLKTKLFFYFILEALSKYHILLFKGPGESFNIFVNQKILGTCPFSYLEYKRYQKKVKTFSLSGATTIIIVAIISSLATNLFFGSWFKTYAATYTFTQTDWNTLSSNMASHSTNQSGWTQYSATSTFIAASSTVMVAASTTTWTVTDDGTTDTGFNNAGASKSSTTVTGTGSGASIKLSANRSVSWAAQASWNPGTFQAFARPAFADLDNDGDYDLMIGQSDGTVYGYKNTGTNLSPVWTAQGSWNVTTSAGQYTKPALADLDNDGDYDLMVGQDNGIVYAYKNTGTNTSPTWTAQASWNTPDVGDYASPALADLDNDGDYDLMIGTVTNGTLVGYKNTGTNLSPTWTAQASWNVSANPAWNVPALADLDGDGNYDLMIGSSNGSNIVYGYKNTGTNLSPTWTAQSSWNTPDLGADRTGPALADLDNDGDYDLMIGKDSSFFSVMVGYKNTGTLTYNSPGTFTSHIFDTTGTVSFGALSWTATTPANTTITIKARSGNQTNLSDATAWGSCANITSGSALSTGGCVTNGHRYVQFQATLSTTDTSVTPTLSDVSLTYTNYPTTAQTLTSSAYDSGSAANLISKISWSTTTPEGANVKFQMRSATTSSDLTWHNWCGYEDTSANCSGGYYFTATSSNVSLPATHSLKSAGAGSPVQDDRWFQYRILLTASPTSTPVVSDVSITYAVNARPDFDMTYGTRGVSVSSQGSDGTYTVSYKIRDIDSLQSTNGSPGPGYVTPSFEYSVDSGNTWNTVTGGLSANATTSKAVDVSGGCTDNCNNYTTHSFTLTPTNISALQNKYYNGTMQIRATIDDGEAANNSTSTTSALFSLDTKAPTVSSVLVKATTSPATISLNVTDDSSFNMKVSTDSNFTGIGWVASSNSTTTSLSSDPSTIYAVFKDQYGNQTATTSVATPETPLNLITQDTSNISSQEFRMFIAWKVSTISSFGSYRLYRSTDGGSTYSLRATITDINTNYYVDTGLTASSTYYYKVSAMDSLGNGSFFSSAIQTIANGTQDAGEGGGGSPSDSPVISSISSGNTTPQSTVITWTTKDAANNNKLSNSKVSYCSPAPCTNYTSNQSVSSYVSSHSVALGSLTPNTTYSYVVTSQDPFGNAATSSNGTTFTTNSGPKITNVSVIDLTESTAKINWDTNVSASNNTVVYSTQNPPSGNQASSEAASTNRTVTLSNLSAATTYYFYAKSQDSDSNWGYDYNISSGQTNYSPRKTNSDIFGIMET